MSIDHIPVLLAWVVIALMVGLGDGISPKNYCSGRPTIYWNTLLLLSQFGLILSMVDSAEEIALYQ